MQKYNRRQTLHTKDTQTVTHRKRRRSYNPHHNTTPIKKKHQVQMALPVPAELAAGWLCGATGAGGCDEHTSDDITGSVAPRQQKYNPGWFSQSSTKSGRCISVCLYSLLTRVVVLNMYTPFYVLVCGHRSRWHKWPKALDLHYTHTCTHTRTHWEHWAPNPMQTQDKARLLTVQPVTTALI